MRKLALFAAGALSVVAVILLAGGAWLMRAHGFSAREQPSAIERWVARRARAAAIPMDARERTNPISDSAEVLASARAHWADHCASCHANNGSGEVEVGQHMYPQAPDMRRPDTQQMTDGELFFIIQNGTRLTGMPAWGNGSSRDEQDTWKLVRFIRHLSGLTSTELREMQALNPKSPDELKEEQEERDFLNGEQPHEQTTHQHH